MASPQIEKGYTRIANELLDQIVSKNLNGTQFRLVLTIWRLTYGIKGKKSNEISVRFLSEKTNANRRQVERELSMLINRNIVRVLGVGEKGARVLQVNKDYDQWDKKDPEQNPDTEPPKQKKQKPNVKPKYDKNNSYYKMAVYFHGLVEKVGQEAGLTHLTKRANLQTWADDMRKLVELDEVDKRLAKDVMDWVAQDDFWKTNTLSASKLRKQFPQLAIKMNAEKQPKAKQQQTDPRDREIALQKWITEGNDPDEFNWNN